MAELTIEQQRALALARARRRRAEDQSDAGDGPWTKYQQEAQDELNRRRADRGEGPWTRYQSPSNSGITREQAQAELDRRRAQRSGAKQFEITAPDGRKYRVTGDNAEGALAALRTHIGEGATAQELPSGDLSANNVMRSLATGVPIIGGALNKMNAATNAALAPLLNPILPDDWDLPGDTFGERYERSLAMQQGMDAAFQEQHPYIDAGLSMTGAVAGTIPAIMAAPAAFGAGGGSLAGRSLISGISGSMLGGADSAVRSEGDADAIATGMMMGGGAGLAGPAVGQVLGKGYHAASDLLARRGAAQTAEMTPRAFGMMSRAIDADDLNPAAVQHRLSEMGPEAMLADLGPNLQRQTGALAATPGRGQEIVRGAIARRQAGAGGRVGGALDNALGQNVDTLMLADDIIAQRSAAAKPLYQKAYEEGAGGIWSPDLERMAGSPVFARAMRQAAESGQDRAVLDGFGSFNPRVTVTPDGRISFNQSRPGGSPLYPDLQYWDYVKRSLDDIAGEAKRAGRAEQASVATGLANKLRSELDNAVPTYKAARDAYSGPSAVMEAMEEGQGVFRNSVTPGAIRQQLSRMGQAERDAYLQGARAQVASIMGTARNDALAARSTFEKGFNREKLELLVGREQAARMLRVLETETAFTRTRDVVTGNSETAARSAAMREIRGGSGPQFGPREGYMAGGILGAARSAGVQGAERILEALNGARRQASNAGLAAGLTTSNPQRIIEALIQSESARRIPQSHIDIAKALMLGGAVGGNR
jgi:hypothetical protein